MDATDPGCVMDPILASGHNPARSDPPKTMLTLRVNTPLIINLDTQSVIPRRLPIRPIIKVLHPRSSRMAHQKDHDTISRRHIILARRRTGCTKKSHSLLLTRTEPAIYRMTRRGRVQLKKLRAHKHITNGICWLYKT
jgi:hypothetical protein